MKAVGVEIMSSEGTLRKVSARKEIVLAAGIHSPQTMQLSGLGPRDLLRQHDIEAIVDLPGVGQNLQDHAALYMALQYGNPIHPNADDIGLNSSFSGEQLELYWRGRRGAYTLTALSGNTVAFLPLPNITADYQSIAKLAISDRPEDLTMMNEAGYAAQRSIIARLYHSQYAAVQETAFSSGATLPTTLVKPMSRGSLYITSSNILDEPTVDFGTFTHPADIEIMMAAERFNRDILATPAMQKLRPVELAPGAKVTSDAALRKALRASVQPTFSHPCCTCAMMPEELGGVVDGNLLVHGVQGLSVVDASTMPLIPATHLSATVYAVAEKAADLIKERHGLAA